MPSNKYVYNSYFWQKQPYVSWKGKSSVSITPINSRPNTNQTSRSASGANSNNIYVQEANDYSSAFGTARPLKLYRKQLKPPRIDSAKSKPNNQFVLDLPNSFVNLGTNVKQCDCKDENNSILGSIQQNILRDSPASDGTNNIYFKSDPECVFFDKCKNKMVRLCCNPENNIIRSANTNINKRYYTTHKAYLKSRVKTYEQNLNFKENKNIIYKDNDGKLFYPTDQFYSWSSLLGIENKPVAPQQFLSTNFIEKSCNIKDCNGSAKKTIIYKPSNQNFSKQGAVSSGLRTLNQQVNTITKNANSFYPAWGREGQNAGRYRGSVCAPLFLKSRYQECIPNLRRRVIWNSGTGRQPAGGFGNHTLCFNTPTGNIKTNTSGDILSQMRGAGTGFLIPEQKIFR